MPDSVSINKLSMPLVSLFGIIATVVVVVWQAPQYVMMKAEADAIHSDLSKTVQVGILKGDIRQAKNSMAYYEDLSTSQDLDLKQQGEYDLLKFGLNRLTAALMELEQ